MASELHTSEGWKAYCFRQARQCDWQAASHERRADELRDAAEEYRDTPFPLGEVGE